MKTAMVTLTALIWATGLSAQTEQPALEIELNAADMVDEACNLSFLVENKMGADIEKAVFETVLFDQDKKVSQLTLLDFGALPMGRPRVRQFALAGQSCAGLSMVLFNGATACEGTGLDPKACETALITGSLTHMELK